jgi:hypothetical protein
MLAYGAWIHSPVVDETAHLAAGISHWELGQFDLYHVNPPLVRMVAAIPPMMAGAKTNWEGFTASPVARSEFRVGWEFFELNGDRIYWLYTIARWACIPFSLIGALACYGWSRQLFGGASATVALVLWCSCPMVLGHGQLITPDVGSAALGITAGFAFWKWLGDPRWGRAYLAGAALGLALLAKFTNLVLLLSLPTVWTLWRWPRRKSGNPSTIPSRRSDLLQLVGLLSLAVFVLNLGYAFDGTFEPLGEYRFHSTALGGNQLQQIEMRKRGHNRFAGSMLHDLPIPLPSDAVRGIDLQEMDFENTKISFLWGEGHWGGWWYFYFAAALLKLPLGTWMLAALAIVWRVAFRCGTASWRDDAALLVPAGLVLATLSMHDGIGEHFRYAIPVLPFVYVWISRLGQSLGRRVLPLPTLTVTALAGTVTSVCSIYPHDLSYFYEAVRGPRNGHHFLLGSNIDWGQDLLLVKVWADEHVDDQPFFMASYGLANPRYTGLKWSLPPFAPTGGANFRPLEVAAASDHRLLLGGLTPGWFAVSVNYLHGYPWLVWDGDGRGLSTGHNAYTYFERVRPVSRIGYSFYVYRLTEADCDYLRRAGPGVEHFLHSDSAPLPEDPAHRLYGERVNAPIKP